MKYVLAFFSCLTLLSCDDGDIVVTDLDFEDQTLERCEDFDFLFFKINPSSNETIALSFETTSQILTNPETVSIQLEGDNTLVYRRFDDEVLSSYFCNPIPPTEPMVTDELVSTAGLVNITTSGNFEDSDGIPSEIEDPTGELDTDGDGLLDIFDEDDDGDNVPTISEGVVFNDDGTIDITLSQDTDADGILDYLDTDDDGDGILTINEDLNGDLDPRNDPNIMTPNYLNNNEATFTEIESFRIHEYSLVDIELAIIVVNAQFNTSGAEETLNITDSILNLGVFMAPDFQFEETPDFIN